MEMLLLIASLLVCSE